MKISTKGRYGLRVMLDLARHGREQRVPLREISRRQNITLKYLEQIITPLVRAGYIKSYRGNLGGYMLCVEPESVTLGDILRTMEGSLAPVACLEDEENTCPRQDECETLIIWRDFSHLVDDYFNGITLADLVNGNHETCNLTHRFLN